MNRYTIPDEVYNDNRTHCYKLQPTSPASPYHYHCVYERMPSPQDRPPIVDTVGNVLQRGYYYGDWVDVTERYRLMHTRYIAEQELERMEQHDATTDTQPRGRGVLDGYIHKHD